MKLKELESWLGDLQQFQKPKIELEQYPTGPHIAARMMYTVHTSYDDISDRIVADFGCGCGTLGIAASMLGAGHVVGVDVDDDAIQLARENCQELEVDMDFVHSEVTAALWRDPSRVDVVVMNPPFGTRQKGADMAFLAAALKVAGEAVYSLHKSSTRDHIQRTALKSLGAQHAEVISQLRYDVPALYKFHKKKEVDIEVDLWRFVPSPK